MSHRMPLAFALTAALASAGCGTLQNVKRPCVAPPDQPDAKVCKLYGGVRNDWDCISEYPFSRTTEWIDYVAIPMMMGSDLFFVGIGDTITLPYTAYETLRREFFPPDPSSEGTQRARSKTAKAQAAQKVPQATNASAPPKAPDAPSPAPAPATPITTAVGR